MLCFNLDNLCRRSFWRAVIVEFLATAILVFIGCGSILIHSPDTVVTSSGDVLRVALTFGLVVTVLVASVGAVSGCHVNPAVSIGLLVSGATTLERAIFYILAQLLGAIGGTGILYLMLPGAERGNLGMTQLSHDIQAWQGFISETVMTFFLVLVISNCIDKNGQEFETYKSQTPLFIGLAVTALHLSEIPYTGTSLNPARSFAPALFKWNWENHWIYWAGPILGAILGAFTNRLLLSPKQDAQLPQPQSQRRFIPRQNSSSKVPQSQLSVDSTASFESASSRPIFSRQASRLSESSSTTSNSLAP